MFYVPTKECKKIAKLLFQNWANATAAGKPVNFKPIDFWQALLANPQKQWQPNCSAYELANCWEDANSLPPNVQSVLNKLLGSVSIVFGFPEFPVKLDDHPSDSQNDIWLLAKNEDELISIAVEGKVKEDFNKTIEKSLKDLSKRSKKPRRVQILCEEFGLKSSDIEHIRYQLLHRAASAVLMAKRVYAKKAILLVHSFHGKDLHFDDFKNFLNLFNVNDARPNKLIFVKQLPNQQKPSQPIDFYAAWISSAK